MSLNVFIGWSGRKSLPVAEKLVTWLKEIIPNIETWISEALTPGTVAWFSDLNERLRRADFAVMCLNTDNWDNPWLSYEPGVVIGKRRKETRVCPYLIDPYALRRNLPEPLKLFWAEKCTEEGTYNLVKIIYEAANGPLTDKKKERQLKRVFKKKWPELWEVIEKAAGPPPPPPSPDPAAYIDDFMKVSRRIEMHKDRLYGQFLNVIRKAVKNIKAGTYKSEAIVELAASEVRLSKERFAADNSLLVGNVCAFFESYYTEDDLQRAIAEMESSLEPAPRNKKTPKRLSLEELESLREGWETYMEVAVAKVFSEYHRILLGKLNNYLGSIMSRS